MKSPLTSDHYDDVYFSAQDGLQETRYVFLDGNDLKARFTDMSEGDLFTIAETGFGTGLNFFAVWQLFDNCAPTDAKLRFISVEKFPLSKDIITESLSHWSDDIGLQLNSMMTSYPNDLKEDFNFDDGRVDLCVMIGDAEQRYSDSDFQADAWFLDGFKPSSNPDMWSDDLLAQVARLTHKGGSFATFTSAGFVRRGLQAAGFDVKKHKGFGRKREMLVGLRL